MDDLLVDLKLPPETLEVPVPNYFTDDYENKARLKKRDKFIRSWMKQKHDVETIPLEVKGYIRVYTHPCICVF